MVVTPDLFRGPPGGGRFGLLASFAFAVRWTPEQVRGDGWG